MKKTTPEYYAKELCPLKLENTRTNWKIMNVCILCLKQKFALSDDKSCSYVHSVGGEPSILNVT